MRKQIISVVIEIEVTDPETFAAAARDRALVDIRDEREAESYTSDDLAACAIMLLDPGISPPGCEIQGSSAEVHSM